MAFLLWLKDALQKHSNIVPGSLEEKIVLKDKFLIQSALDIYRKLLKKKKKELADEGRKYLDQMV